MTRPARIAVVHYGATATCTTLAHPLADGARGEVAEVRVRHVEELASDLLISQNQYWCYAPTGAQTRRYREAV